MRLFHKVVKRFRRGNQSTGTETIVRLFGKDARLDGQGASFLFDSHPAKKQRNGWRFAAAVLPAPIFHERMA